MVTELIFTDDEIRSQLEAIGLEDVTDAQLRLFRQDLERLIDEEAEARKLSTLLLRRTADNTPASLTDKLAASTSRTERGSINNSVCSKRNYVRIEKAMKVKPDGSLPVLPSLSSLGDKLIELSNLRPISQNSQSTRDSSESTSQPRTRKVLRRIDGKSVVCDETPSQSGDSNSSVNNFNQIPDFNELRPPNSRMKLASDPVILGSSLRRTKSVSLSGVQKPLSKSQKSDPVALYHYYKREWERHKAPGEKNHSELRWNIRRSMMLMEGQRASSAAAIL